MTRRPYDVPDRGLWDDVKRSIQPLKKGRADKQLAAQRLPSGSSFATSHAQPLSLPPRHRHEPPPLAAFDRRTAQKLSRGQLEPDARIDLHGETLETARMKLYHFIQREHANGTRLMLVITGKGASPYAGHTLHGRELYHAPERDGRLRREVPIWLHDSLFRAHVVGYQPAHPRHGGGGALYVRLRRNSGEGP